MNGDDCTDVVINDEGANESSRSENDGGGNDKTDTPESLTSEVTAITVASQQGDNSALHTG